MTLEYHARCWRPGCGEEIPTGHTQEELAYIALRDKKWMRIYLPNHGEIWICDKCAAKVKLWLMGQTESVRELLRKEAEEEDE